MMSQPGFAGASTAGAPFPKTGRGYFHLTPRGLEQRDTDPFPPDCCETWLYEMKCEASDAKKQVSRARIWRRPLIEALLAYFAAIFLALLSSTSTAMAQDRSNGELIANTQCSRCHVIIGTSPKEGRSGSIPSFSEVANMPSTTQTSLREFLSMPHARMPNYRLTRQDVLDITDYILSLKS